MHDDDGPLEPYEDGMHPPAVPTEVFCLHCKQLFESYLIEWRVKTCHDGRRRGFWSCPDPECDGVGFGCDLWPTDPDYEDERGITGWLARDGDDEDEEYDKLEDLPDLGPDDHPPDFDSEIPY